MRTLARLVSAAALVALLTLASAAGHHRYGPDAGFPAARAQEQPIKLWRPAAWNLKLAAAKNAWNDLAGWSLFVIVQSEAKADVVFADDAIGNYTVCLDDTGTFNVLGPYVSCVVNLSTHTGSDGNTRLTEHELGHVLGFAHHTVAANYQREVDLGWNPRVCDDTSHPAWSPYVGVMWVCGLQVLTLDDRAGLDAAGYAG
jgi:hypothetical protein